MPLVATAPFTMEELRAWLRVSDASQDALLEIIGNSATETLERLTGRIFVERTITERRSGDGTTRLELTAYPVSTVSSVTEDGIAVAASSYRLDGPAGVLWRLNGVWIRGEGNVDVVYTAGWPLASVPGDVKRVALEMAKVIWDEWGGQAASVTSLAIGPASLTIRQAWPHHVATAIDALRRDSRVQPLVT